MLSENGNNLYIADEMPAFGKCLYVRKKQKQNHNDQ